MDVSRTLLQNLLDRQRHTTALRPAPIRRSAARKGIRRLDGRVAVVTGAANGIGRALAVALHRKGCHLALVDIDSPGLTALRNQLETSDLQRRVTAHATNVGDRDAMRALAQAVAAAHGAVHVLINNAGIGHEAAFPQTSLDDWERLLRVNLWGVLHGCHFFMPYLAKVDRAHIVNMSSLFGLIGMPGQSAYSTAKFAIRGLSECLWEELRATTVGLTVVHPAAVATGIMTRTTGDDPELLARVARWYERHAIAPERAAARIVRAIERGTPRLLIGLDTGLADRLKRWMPVLGNRLFSDLVIRVLDVEDMRVKRSEQWQQTMVEGRKDGQ
jgi:NAD(P)-dependent dehydrogenase (short-subunit alcohol dehydrogenase family)